MHNERMTQKTKKSFEEWSRIYQNRLGELCASRKPGERQIQRAKIEADACAAKQRKAKAE